MPNAKTHWTKKVESFGRTLFLISSSVFAVMLGLVLIDKTNTISDSTEFLAIPIVATWFTSFVVWMIFLIANSRVGKFLKPKASTSRLGKIVKIIAIIVFSFVILFFVIYLLILRPHKTTGGSMTPNFTSGEYVLSEKVTYYFNAPKRGDVIVFKRPDYENQEFFARIVGLPGDYISIRKDHVYINNKILEEPYIGANLKTATGSFIGEANLFIPEDKYFVLGDNRSHSNDSRSYGFVAKKDIKGRFFYIYWPKAKTGFVSNPFQVDTATGNSIIN